MGVFGSLLGFIVGKYLAVHLALSADLLAEPAALVDARPPTLVRLEAALSSVLDYPRLRVSLPFVAQDDVQGSHTSTCLVAMLESIGQTPEDCGDISVDTLRPSHAGPELGGDLPFTDATLDSLEQLLSSPLWSSPADADPAEPLRTRLSPRATASA